MKILTLADWTGMLETELFAQTYKRDGVMTVRYPVLEVSGTVEQFENGRGFSLRVIRRGSRTRGRVEPLRRDRTAANRIQNRNELVNLGRIEIAFRSLRIQVSERGLAKQLRFHHATIGHPAAPRSSSELSFWLTYPFTGRA